MLLKVILQVYILRSIFPSWCVITFCSVFPPELWTYIFLLNTLTTGIDRKQDGFTLPKPLSLLDLSHQSMMDHHHLSSLVSSLQYWSTLQYPQTPTRPVPQRTRQEKSLIQYWFPGLTSEITGGGRILEGMIPLEPYPIHRTQGKHGILEMKWTAWYNTHELGDEDSEDTTPPLGSR